MTVQPKWTSAERLWSKTVCLSPAHLCLISAPLSHECLFAALNNFECLSRWLYISCGSLFSWKYLKAELDRHLLTDAIARSRQFANEKSREHLDTFVGCVTLSSSILHSQWLVLTEPISVDWPIAKCCFVCCTFVFYVLQSTQKLIKSHRRQEESESLWRALLEDGLLSLISCRLLISPSKKAN